MNLDPVELQALAREIAFRLDPDGLLDSADVAAYLKCERRYVTDFYMGSPGFPKAIRLPAPSGGKGFPKWRRSAIVAYVKKIEAGTGPSGGRPRAQVD